MGGEHRWKVQKVFHENNRIILSQQMLPYRNQAQNSSANKRKTKEGDWICIRCANYNYSFRNLCNRCRQQSKDENNNVISLFATENYGENSFPSVLFLKLDPLKAKDSGFPSLRENCQKVDKLQKLEQGLALRENRWIHNLINE